MSSLQLKSLADLDERASEQEYPTQAGRNVLKRLKSNEIFVSAANRITDIKQVIGFADEHDINAVIVGAREAWVLADGACRLGYRRHG